MFRLNKNLQEFYIDYIDVNLKLLNLLAELTRTVQFDVR
jgi:hypothetical protein